MNYVLLTFIFMSSVIKNSTFLADQLLTHLTEIGKHFWFMVRAVHGSMNGGFVIPEDIEIYDLVLLCYLKRKTVTKQDKNSKKCMFFKSSKTEKSILPQKISIEILIEMLGNVLYTKHNKKT